MCSMSRLPLTKMLKFLWSGALATAFAAPFITRNGTSLMYGNAGFRFVGGNMYWLGLDENVGGVHYPTKYRIYDGLYTAVDMGLSVIRSHSLGISTGNALSFRPACGDNFNSTALDAADYAVYLAEVLGLKLIIPLTDNYHYYHGGKHDFSDCYGLPETAFYSDSRVIADFQSYVRARFEHVNPYTGRAAMDEPAILAWETGNELDSPANWTAVIASFIKSVDGNHLVLDGHYGVNPQSLTISSVDMISDHFYPIDLNRLGQGASQTAAAGKVYIAGEYAWTDLATTASFLAQVNTTATVAGSAFWSLFPHVDTYGFVQHDDSFTVHFPGDNAGMATFVQMVHNASAVIEGMPGPAPWMLPLQPTVNGLLPNGTLTWQGAAGADTYSVDISTTGVNGPWQTVCSMCVTDDGLPYVVPGGVPSVACVRVQPFSPSGAGGPTSNPWQNV